MVNLLISASFSFAAPTTQHPRSSHMAQLLRVLSCLLAVALSSGADTRGSLLRTEMAVGSLSGSGSSSSHSSSSSSDSSHSSSSGSGSSSDPPLAFSDPHKFEREANLTRAINEVKMEQTDQLAAREGPHAQGVDAAANAFVKKTHNDYYAIDAATP